ncbi:MAG: AraC-like DNA-binding protein [Oleispira sp.]|jgi:AraC-like DNA-binding protein
MIQSSISVALIRPLIDAMSGKAPFIEPELTIDARLIKLLKDPDARIPSQEADALISNLVRSSNSDSLCVFSAQKAAAQSSCQLQHLFLCSNTLREALHYLEKFSSLLSDNLEINVTRTRDSIIKIKLPVNEQSFLSQERYRSELLVGILLGWLKQLCGTDMSINGIDLPFPQPSYADDYAKLWQANIVFNSTECCIKFDAKYLDQGLHNTNPHILNMIKRDVEEQYKKLTRLGSLADRIKRALNKDKLSLKANQQIVAEHFHISPRTLNRHLQKESTSLKQVITECRVIKAKMLLSESDLNIEQIALQLGLSGRRTLDRIFIKQTKDSPAQYRNKQKNHTVPDLTSVLSVAVS